MSKIEAFWLDEQGQPCAPQDAVAGEIVEMEDDGLVVQRTYVDRVYTRPETGPGSDALTTANTDLKSSWDLFHVEDGMWTPLVKLGQLWQYLRLTPDMDLQERRQRVGDFLTLPVWEFAPQELKDETYGWLEDTRSTNAG